MHHIESVLLSPLFGFGVALVLTVVGWKLTATSADWVLFAAWCCFVTFLFRIPPISNQVLVQRGLWTLLVSSVIGLVLCWISGWEPASTAALPPFVATAEITLHSLFVSDFDKSFGVNTSIPLADENGNPETLEGRVLIDPESASRFVAFYVPRSDHYSSIFHVIAEQYWQMNGEAFKSLQLQGPSEAVFSRDYKPSGRVFIYHENLLHPEETGRVHEMFRVKGLLLELRGSGYLQTIQLMRNAKK